jgi:antitoxin component of MazEF toxin-antitoxin module
MATTELKVARIGNSRGVRLPARTLDRYQIGDRVLMEERSDGILLRPHGSATPMLSWEDTAGAMAAEREEWVAWDATAGDGLEVIPWDPAKGRRVAEPASGYKARGRRKK